MKIYRVIEVYFLSFSGPLTGLETRCVFTLWDLYTDECQFTMMNTLFSAFLGDTWFDISSMNCEHF